MLKVGFAKFSCSIWCIGEAMGLLGKGTCEESKLASFGSGSLL